MAKSLKKSAKRATDDRQQDPSAANIDPRTEADIGRLVDKYKNRSESSLMDELLRVTEQQKRDGTLDSAEIQAAANSICLLYTSPSPRDPKKSRMPSSA